MRKQSVCGEKAQTSSDGLGAVELDGLAVVDGVCGDEEGQQPRVRAARLVHLGGVDAVPRAVDHRDAAVAHNVAVHRRQRLLALRAQHDPREQSPRQRQQLHHAQPQQLPPAAPLRVALAKVPHRQPHAPKLCAPCPSSSPLLAHLVSCMLPHLPSLSTMSLIVTIPSTTSCSCSSSFSSHCFFCFEIEKEIEKKQQTRSFTHSFFFHKTRHFFLFLFFLSLFLLKE